MTNFTMLVCKVTLKGGENVKSKKYFRMDKTVCKSYPKDDGSVRYTHINITREKGYFTHDINGGGDSTYNTDNICKMIEFLMHNIFVQFGGPPFHQMIGIPMGTNCAP